MSKRSTMNKGNKKINSNNTSNNNTNNKQLNSNYNVIINQNSTFNQDNSINIMLDGAFPYFQNYNYQSNEADLSNPKYSFYQDYQQIKTQENQTNSQKNNSNEKNSNSINNSSKSIKNKNSIIINKGKENSPPKKNENDIYEQMNQRSTNKIDYRYVKKCPIKDMISTFKNECTEFNINDKENQLFWLATYGKLMKTKHLMKIFNYYNNKTFEHSNNDYSLPNLKEKTLIIKDFEIYFYENSNKPFIRYAKGGTIYAKLYLLTLKQINQIFSYINRIEYKINYDRLNYLQRKGTFEIINDNSNGIILPYCLIYCLGKYMNINIYSFSNNIDFNIYLDEISFHKNQRISSYTVLNNNNNCYFGNENNNHNHNHMNNTNIKSLNFKLPNSKKIAKLVKIINLNFPDFSIEDIINYLIPDNKYLNSITKINEIKNILFFKKSNQNKIILSSMVRDTIKGISIQTPKSLISSFCPAESIIENNSIKNSDLFQPATNKKYLFPIKDDYKFQTISTNEKENNKNNPFIIYVCDNVPKINLNENQISISGDMNLNKMENNYSSGHSKTESNIQNNTNHKLNQIKNNKLNNNNGNEIINNKIQNIAKEKINPNRKSLENKKKQNKYKNDVSKVFTSEKKKMKVQRISTDVRERIKSGKYSNITGIKNLRNKIRGSNAISHTNIIIGNNNNNPKGQLNKSIDSHNNFTARFRLSKTSDISQRRKQKSKNYNNVNLINRINMNKKDMNNPFFNES